MQINFLTLFPNYFKPFMEESITKRAIEKGLLKVCVIDLRAFTQNKHKKVDDEVYGGGHGMLLQVEPIDLALQKIEGKKVLLTPQGQIFKQSTAQKWSTEKQITFISGHYEGFDERVSNLVDEKISIGDYVLTGGELPSMVLADAIVRLLPGVIKKDSHINDSFTSDLLDFPQYTRPRSYKGWVVPGVLLSGDHKKIAEWRFKKQEEITKIQRPDLYKKYLERNQKNEK